MNEATHPDAVGSAAIHPDADQLSAFAEQALPAHEREQMLAHLAGCAACRVIVFTAQQGEPEEAGLPLPVAVRKPWYAGWNLLWPVAALAVLMIVTVSLRQPRKTSPAEVANVAVPPPAGLVDTPARTLPPRSVPAHSADVVPAASRPKEEKERAVDKLHTGTRGPAALPVPLTPGRHVVSGNAASAQIQLPPQPQSKPTPANIVVTDQAAMQANAPLPAPPALQGMAGQASAAPRIAQAQSGPQQIHGYAPAQAGQSLQTSQFSNATPIVDGATFASAEATLLPARMLPSGLPLRSSASDAGRELALDSAGALFLSRDGGRSWTTVARAWQGKVISVSSASVSSPVGAMLRPSFRARLIAPATAATTAGGPGESRDAAQVAGTVADPRGAVIPGATVRVGPERQTVSDASGRFVLAGMAPGTYKVEVSGPGFMTYVREVVLNAGDRATLGVVLQIGSAAETVQVETSGGVVAAKAKKPAPFRLSTDAGEVWMSSDGLKWKREK